MTNKSLLFSLFLTAAVLPGAAQAQSVMALTPQDYIDIAQLTASYTHAVDNCSNRGYDYADLYADDGTFGVSREWGVPGKVWAQGRDALAKAGGGTEDGCRVKLPGTQGYGLHHIVTSQVIEPTVTGAKGRSTLLTLGVGGKPTNVEWQGGYEDVYVKTEKGWRIQSRWHVWPNLEESIQFKANPLPASLLPDRAAVSPSGQ